MSRKSLVLVILDSSRGPLSPISLTTVLYRHRSFNTRTLDT